MGADHSFFGSMPDGTPVEQYILRAGTLECGVITYGGALRFLRTPDKTGKPVDILLGFDTLDSYRAQDKYIGGMIGRFANRIGGSRFQLQGREYLLLANDGVNHLHGGGVGFDKQVWSVDGASESYLSLSLTSPDGQEGYPGELSVQVTYTLNEGGLTLDYRATSNRMTLCSLTNHAYFNLAGHDSGPVLDQEIQLLASRFTPADQFSIPTGTLADVAGTPMDLRQLTPIGAQINRNYPQLQYAGGYDHNWVIDGGNGTLRPVARAVCPSNGVSLEVLSTMPGVQFYTGNYLDGCPAGKGGAVYGKRCGFCLETQYFPNSPNLPQFPSAVLRSGTLYHHTTRFALGVES